MATRTQKATPESLDYQYHLADPDIENEGKRKEATELVRQLLGHLREPCEQVVRLYHIEGYSDEEVVQQKMTRYSTPDSLKMKRSDCMKKLIQLAQQWKTINNI
jgi:DNA-directed RNA polymerase specialized sigma24 family protein